MRNFGIENKIRRDSGSFRQRVFILGGGQAVKVLCCWSRLCLVWTAWPLHVLVFPLLPPFLPHFPSPHPGIQGHHGRGDTGPLAQDTGYRGYFYLWISRTRNHTSRRDALILFSGNPHLILVKILHILNLNLVCSLMVLNKKLPPHNLQVLGWTLLLGGGAGGRGGRLGNKAAGMK